MSDGTKVVPVEPTDEMVDAGQSAPFNDCTASDVLLILRAGIAAAPAKQRQDSHREDCWKSSDHHECAVVRIKQLQEAVDGSNIYHARLLDRVKSALDKLHRMEERAEAADAKVAELEADNRRLQVLVAGYEKGDF